MTPGNGGGNPNHDPEDGRFTSGPGGGGEGEFGARWNEFNSKGELVGKEKIFKTAKARELYLDKLNEKGSFHSMQSTFDSPSSSGGDPHGGGVGPGPNGSKSFGGREPSAADHQEATRLFSQYEFGSNNTAEERTIVYNQILRGVMVGKSSSGGDPLKASSHGPIDAHTTVTKTVLQQLKDVGVKVTKAPKDSEGFLRWHLEVEGHKSTDKYILTSEAGHIKHVLAYKGGHALRDPSAHQVWTFLEVQRMF